jgi:hypothetical protein
MLNLETYDELPLFAKCLTLSDVFNVIDEWHLKNTKFDKIQQYLETTEEPKLLVHASDGVHPYHNRSYNKVLFYLREYFSKNSKAQLIYYSVNNYHSVFNGVKNIRYHWIPEYHGHYWPIYQNIDIIDNDISKKFLCLNKRASMPRWLTYKKFYTDNLLDQSIFSFLGEDQRWGKFESKSIVEHFEITIKKYYPQFAHLQAPKKMFCRVDDDQNLTSYLDNYQVVSRSCDYSTTILADPSWILDHNYYQQTFCSVINETSLDADKPNFSEKTFRAICHGHPFIIIGSRYSLKFLRELGLDTYDDIFDNSYDTIADPWYRLLAVFNTIDQISNKDITKLDKIKKDLHARRIKNRDVYHTLYNKLLLKTNNLLDELNEHLQSQV